MSENAVPRCHGFDCTSTSLIRAHIIPKGIARLLNQNGRNISISPTSVGTAKRQLGEFDDKILCEQCDNKLGAFDDYGVEICKTFPDRHRRVPGDIFEVDNFDGNKFCKFVLAVLWRASISNKPAFDRVELGPYEPLAREVLYGARSLSDMPAFEVFAFRYTSTNPDPTHFYIHPSAVPMFGRRAYVLPLVGFRLLARLSNKKWPVEARQLALNGKNVMRGGFIELEKTLEFKSLASRAHRPRTREHKTKL